jgi:hypothetical protein
MTSYRLHSAGSALRQRRYGCLTFFAALLLAASPSQSEIPSATQIAGTPLWLESTTKHPHLITVGAHSSELKRLVARILGGSYQCAAIALMRFDPAVIPESTPWHASLDGMPTAATVELVARDAERGLIQQSLQRFWNGPYETNGGLWIISSITTQAHGSDRFLSTIVTSLVDGENRPVGGSQPPEPIIRILWARHDRRLLAIYKSAE